MKTQENMDYFNHAKLRYSETDFTSASSHPDTRCGPASRHTAYICKVVNLLTRYSGYKKIHKYM